MCRESNTKTTSFLSTLRGYMVAPGRRPETLPDFRGEPAWGYVSRRTALSDSGSFVTRSKLKSGEEALNPITMQ
jgi:hypothetical protein